MEVSLCRGDPNARGYEGQHVLTANLWVAEFYVSRERVRSLVRTMRPGRRGRFLYASYLNRQLARKALALHAYLQHNPRCSVTVN